MIDSKVLIDKRGELHLNLHYQVAQVLFLDLHEVNLNMAYVTILFNIEAVLAPYCAWLIAIKTNSLDRNFAAAAPALLSIEQL